MIRRLCRSRLLVVGVLLSVLPLAFAIAAPLIAPHPPNEQTLSDRFLPPLSSGARGYHLLGTDALGRDLLSRIIYGAQISMLVGVTVVIIGGLLGTGVGIVAGYWGGAIDALLMRIVDVFLAFPFLLIALVLMAMLGSGLSKVIIVLGLTSWVPYARVARAQVLGVKEREFVEASRAIGAGRGRIIARHIVPNVMSSVIVIASFRVAAAILSEATLSFLGVGVPPGTPSWGGILSEGRPYMLVSWGPTVFAGVMIMLTALSCNLIGDGVRDLLDPRWRK
ncbi:MAG: ABC transporter permease [Candidatus Bipolaricaulis sp.]|nr:ABC transporter permease [Candidatus Bipolaricaulis sp.]